MGFKQNQLTLNQCDELSPANAMWTCYFIKEKENQFRLNTYTLTNTKTRIFRFQRDTNIRNTKYARNNLQWIQSVILWKHCKSHYAISPITLLRCTNSCTNTSCTMYNNEIDSVVVLCSVQKTMFVFKRLIIFKHCCLQSLNLVIPLM